jgi:hypothetical protein
MAPAVGSADSGSRRVGVRLGTPRNTRSARTATSATAPAAPTPPSWPVTSKDGYPARQPAPATPGNPARRIPSCRWTCPARALLGPAARARPERIWPGPVCGMRGRCPGQAGAAARALTSWVVSGLPAIPQSPLRTSSTTTQVTWRRVGLLSVLGPRSNARTCFWRFLAAGQGIASSNRPSRQTSGCRSGQLTAG